ncbi:response regulator transcription factor [Aquimarina sp. W85]|uniref:response regulator transcription factor n=1 Tax=Aquimarina rhodophyticola TaxID=3342246 RepID=UPI00367032A9
MNFKSSNNLSPSQDIIAGILSTDDSIEFFGIRSTKQVKYIQNGNVFDFNQLHPKHFITLYNAYRRDITACHYLKTVSRDSVAQVELYTYYCYGDLDYKPDMINGVLQPAENFRDKINCPSLNFKSKNITIDGAVLTPRDIYIIDMVANELTDKCIADSLGITLSTLGFHKKNLFKKINVQSKVGLIKKAMTENIPMS